MSKVAAIQMASGSNVQANLDEAAKLIEQAASQGAGLIVLPENFSQMPMTEQERVGNAENAGDGRVQNFLSTQSEKNSVWIVGGTVPLKSEEKGKAYSSSLLFDDKGTQVARYDKLHMFDVLIEESNETYNESATTVAGDEVVVVDSPFGRLGLSICYDLRFPELFRMMIDQGMEVCVIPSAFTAFTGQSHWEPLIRARAIENQCYVIAAAQGGYHVNNRQTYGHSMIVNPWGNILGSVGTGPGVVITELARKELETIRKNFQALKHRRLNCRVG
ncbi:FIG003879: Predicted amidohydrolase [hydrothermal vent metagenome]|uniref:FIG003879: Predicted amidohydrolase n=1 Tax=hydrothermal vent metagenome TaxID=652676 RepID=A0A3B0Y318_9ZZZZ